VVNTVKLFGHCYAATELPQIIEYDPVTLETLGKVDVKDKIPGLATMTPHPLYDEDGTLWNIGFATGPDRHGEVSSVWRYVVFKVTPPKNEEERKNPWLNLEVVNELSSSKVLSISYLHSFFMTQNYLIFTEQPWIFGHLPSVIYGHLWLGKTLGETMFWDDDTTLKFHIVDKKTGKFLPIKYEADPMGFFHIFNAYEENDSIVLDAPFNTKGISYDAFTRKNLKSDPKTVWPEIIEGLTLFSKRWILPLNVPDSFTPPSQMKLTGDGLVDPGSYPLLTPADAESKAWLVEDKTVYLQPAMLAPADQYKYHRSLEFVAINPQHASKRYRYAYGLGFPTGFMCGTIQKLDVEKKSFTARWEDKTCRATEPQFIPRPGSVEEDDGVVVFACLGTNSSQPKTDLIVLEPDNLSELGRFSVPTITPISFHGVWVK